MGPWSVWYLAGRLWARLKRAIHGGQAPPKAARRTAEADPLFDEPGGPRESGVGIFKYLKAAFVWPWNLLALAGATGFALLSGHADVALPLVLAAEAAYLGLLGTHPKFQAAIEARDAKAVRGTPDAEQSLQRILAVLPKASVQRFEALRSRCQELRQIALRLNDPRLSSEGPPLEGLQVASLDRLLWTYLRLLYTQTMLDRFLQQTNAEQIERTIKNLEQALRSQSVGDDDPQKQKIRRTLEDNLRTSQERLSNLDKARANRDFVGLELDRLENKIQSLSEMAINRQEPDWVAGQIDQVANTMVQTERTMNDLKFATGLPEEDEAPPLVRRQRLTER